MLCPATQFGYQMGSGDLGAAFTTAMGMGTGQLSAALKSRGLGGYLAGVAIDVYSCGFSQAAKTDFSGQAMSSTLAYAAANPTIVAQETVKAAGVVLGNLWSAFVPRW
ncbi:hypothetical protein SAMN05444374_109188 [Rhodococcoides kroppenstedtii]|uniref:Uncharacterized protein n=1 Tax=Rhodococcoides kroppenstedtii TaxID=293050 RepID=A0A1I0TWR3_9NOCA|nr:hypothetical protein SAMN05444374_109188 [Rhodococcus kroppenstedtii]